MKRNYLLENFMWAVGGQIFIWSCTGRRNNWQRNNNTVLLSKNNLYAVTSVWYISVFNNFIKSDWLQHIDKPFEHGGCAGVARVGAAVSAADEHGKDGEQSADDAGRQHDCRDGRRHIDTITATDDHRSRRSTSVDVLSRCFQHHLQQLTDRRTHVSAVTFDNA